MATDDLTYGGTTSRLPSESAMPAFIHLGRTIDFSVTANSVSNGDVLQVVPIPAGMFVQGAYVNVITQETSTALLGDGDSTGGWLGTFTDLNVTITYICNSTTTYGQQNNSRGKYYPLADTLDFIPTNTLNSAKVKVGCWGFMMNKPPTEA